MADIKKLVDELSKLSVMEAVELSKALEEAWHTESYQRFCEQEGYLEREGFEGQEGFQRLIDDEYEVMTEFLRAAGVIR